MFYGWRFNLCKFITNIFFPQNLIDGDERIIKNLYVTLMTLKMLYKILCIDRDSLMTWDSLN